jgi:hypothetical protein
MHGSLVKEGTIAPVEVLPPAVIHVTAQKEDGVETLIRTEKSAAWTDPLSGVSWASIAAGAVAAAALSLALFALGAGLGLSSISPWAESGISASTFKTATGIYLVLVAVMSSAIGGYLAARLRTKWTDLDTNEVFFRDTAHGFIAWAFATVLSASVLTAAITQVLGGAATSAVTAAAQSAQSVDPSQIYVDRLFRADAPVASSASTTSASGDAVRAEVTRLWASSFRANTDLAPADRTYVARLVASQTGMTQAEAEKRVNDVIVEAKSAADRARKSASSLAFWVTASLLFGAFAASLAAVEGGQLRDGTWNGRRIVPRPW